MQDLRSQWGHDATFFFGGFSHFCCSVAGSKHCTTPTAATQKTNSFSLGNRGCDRPVALSSMWIHITLNSLHSLWSSQKKTKVPKKMKRSPSVPIPIAQFKGKKKNCSPFSRELKSSERSQRRCHCSHTPIPVVNDFVEASHPSCVSDQLPLLWLEKRSVRNTRNLCQ